MKKIEKVIYLTAEEIDRVVAERELETLSLAPGMARQRALHEVHQLRSYAAMKRLLAPSSL